MIRVLGPPPDLSAFVMRALTKDLAIPSYMIDPVTDVRSASEMSMILKSGKLPAFFKKSRHLGESVFEEWAAKHWEQFAPDFVAMDFRAGLSRKMLWTKYPEYTKAQIRKFTRRRC